MKLLDDLAAPEEPRLKSRRSVLAVLTLGSLGTSIAGTLAICLRFLWPAVLFELPSRFRATRLASILRIPILFLRKRRVYVVKDDKGIFAQTAVCTHLGCLTRPNQSNDGFFCPCHGSKYALDGTVTKGPAPLPLQHYAVERRHDDLWVDTAVKETKEVRLNA